MTTEVDLARIAHQEQSLRFKHFDVDLAWSIGCQLRDWAAQQNWPIVIDIRRFDTPLFLAAMKGSSPDNIDWARRKSNVVQRFHRSSYGLGLELQAKKTSLEIRYGLTLADYAAHGGGFPLAVDRVGVIGSVTVSGLPQRDDHSIVVRALCAVLNKSEGEFALEPPS